MEIPIKVQEYLQRHNIDPRFAKEVMCWNWTENAITIPIYSKVGKKLYDKVRNLNYEEEKAADLETHKFIFDPPGSHPTLYSTHLLKEKHKVVVLSEGEPDCVCLLGHGFAAVTSTGGVGKFDETMAAQLTGREVIIFLDTDIAGQDQIVKVAQTLMAVGVNCRIGILPESVKDVSEYFATGATTEDFQKLMSESLSLNAYIIAKNQLEKPIIKNDVFMAQELPKNKWLIHKVVRSSGIHFWVGIGGVGKTTIVYTAVKAVTEGSLWLGLHQATKGAVLLLDKENEAIDIQTSLRALKVFSPDLHHYTMARDFQFLDDNGELTEEALYVKAYCEENKVIAVVMDSMIDFFVGDENQATYAALNLNAWLKTFPGISINIIHHESKELPNQKKSGSMRMRGSTHLFNAAQGVLNLSKLGESTPEQIKVEQTKVRGSRQLKPFQIDMVIETDPENPEETVITGFKYIGEIVRSMNAAERAEEAIINLLAKSPQVKYSKVEVVNALKGVIGEQTVKSVLLNLSKRGLVNCDASSGKAHLYSHKEDIESYIDNPDNFR